MSNSVPAHAMPILLMMALAVIVDAARKTRNIYVLKLTRISYLSRRMNTPTLLAHTNVSKCATKTNITTVLTH